MTEKPASFLDRLSTAINAAVEKSLFVIGFGMAAVVAVQVFCRYVLNHSLFWSEELARYLLVWLTFLGASAAYRRRLHPGVDFFHRLLPPASGRAVTRGIHIASLAFFAVLSFFGCKFTYFVRLQISPALNLPKWILFGIVPLSSAIFMVHGLAFLLHGSKRGAADDR